MAQQNIKSDAKVSKAKARKKRKLADVNGAAHIHSTVNTVRNEKRILPLVYLD